MFQPSTVKHADPQASILPGTNSAPALQGQTVSAALIAEALAVLQGEMLNPSSFFRNPPPCRIARVRKYAELAPPVVTLETLAEAYSDVEEAPLEAAFEEILLEMMDGDSSMGTIFRNPRFHYEIRQAHRRTLEHLLSLAGAEVQA